MLTALPWWRAFSALLPHAHRFLDFVSGWGNT